MENGEREEMDGVRIREASRILGVPTHTLRFWERRLKGLISPARSAGGQRRYDPQTLERIRLLKQLLYEKGLTLAGARYEMERRVAPTFGMEEAEMDRIVARITEQVQKRLMVLSEGGRKP